MTTESNIKKFGKELKELIDQGNLLSVSLRLDLHPDLDGKMTNPETGEKIDTKKLNLPSFRENYENWYSLSMQVIQQILPDRLDDFVTLYKNEKRKEVDYLTYGVSDYMIGLCTTRLGEVLIDGKAAILKFDQQLNILKSSQSRLESSLFNMIEILQADLFDNELDGATELIKKGFLRGAGAIAGVVLEKHLGHVCVTHKLKTRKKAPTINDFNQMLKDNNIIDTPMWRSIQHLADIRNLCDHNKDRPPTKEEVSNLVSGVQKIIKTLF